MDTVLLMMSWAGRVVLLFRTVRNESLGADQCAVLRSDVSYKTARQKRLRP